MIPLASTNLDMTGFSLPVLLLFLPLPLRLAELPSVSADQTEDKGGHRLVRRARLQLRVRAVLLLTLAALEHVGGGACKYRRDKEREREREREREKEMKQQKEKDEREKERGTLEDTPLKARFRARAPPAKLQTNSTGVPNSNQGNSLE